MSVVPKTAAAKAFVSISVDVHSGTSDDASGQQNQAIEAVTSELLDRFAQLRLCGTWALAQPMLANSSGASLVNRLTSDGASHEIALLADPLLAKRDLSRTDIMQSVVCPLQLAKDSGIAISTLATEYSWQPRHIDLLTKYGITVLRTPHVFSSRTTTGVRAVCYGLWHVPVSVSMKGGGWMANLSQWRIARRVIEQAVLRGGWCHVRIDIASIVAGDVSCALRTIDRLLRHLVQLRSAGHLASETLCETAGRLAPKRNAAAAQSILRAA